MQVDSYEDVKYNKLNTACVYQAWATFPSLGAKLSFCPWVKGRTKLLNKIN
jgi:hypothetical protein